MPYFLPDNAVHYQKITAQFKIKSSEHTQFIMRPSRQKISQRTEGAQVG